MKILVINCGSSTLKFQIIETEEDTAPDKERRLAFGTVEKIGSGQGKMEFIAEKRIQSRETDEVPDHAHAARKVLDFLKTIGLLTEGGVNAVGHRVVHGGYRFTEPTVIDEEVLDAIEAISHLALLHNHPALMTMRMVREILGSHIPMVAVFDTSFHSRMPDRASHYAIPRQWAVRHHIRRYGFHGIAHRYMAERYATITSKPIEEIKIITLQLGNGCSSAAVEGGRSIDTSMGLTPLEGLMMGTRSGDVDPHLPGFLARSEGVTVEEVERWLNTKSGLLGVSGLSQDMRELLEAESRGDENAALAVEMFCYRVRRQVGAYLAALGGAEALVFGGGIGENSPPVRGRICSGMEWCGMAIDENLNSSLIGSEGRISREDAKLHAYVIPVDEAVVIARDTALCISKQKKE